jgi:rubrerythrin
MARYQPIDPDAPKSTYQVFDTRCPSCGNRHTTTNMGAPCPACRKTTRAQEAIPFA